ncbi:MAG TPA: hypothetical protein VG870_03955 [Chitinophagaceae bacterium]|nr:hypothetical protein [Chitinophagaceae bacterium]
MTRQQFFEIAGYFANPIRNTRIEIEARQNTINAYNSTYQALTGTPIPIGNDSVYVLPNNADKWGREMRLYFTVTNAATIPTLVNQWMTVGGRPGYDLWDQRLNSKDIIDELFEIGFTLGHPQNLANIQALIPPGDLADFNNGYNAA